jgi:sirohydrochlorin ferrochelatase
MRDTAIIIVDHGSRSRESNRLLDEVAARFARRFGERFAIVEAAHMELAEPTIAQAYARAVAQGARRIVICPFFLGPGKHIREDIPRLAQEAARAFPDTEYLVAAPLGADDLILELLFKRLTQSLKKHEGAAAGAVTLTP